MDTETTEKSNLTAAERAEALDNFIAAAVSNGLFNVRVQGSTPRDRFHPGVGIWLKDGSDIPCMAVVEDEELGNWSCLTESGQVRQYLFDEVR